MADVILCACGGKMNKAGKWRCDRCGEDLPHFTAEMAKDPLLFIESMFLIKDEETGLPRLIRLEPFQREMLRDAYPPDLGGHARARNGLLSQPKKQGKSTILGALGQYHACRKRYAEVYVLATTRDQARAVLYDKILYSVTEHPYWGQFCMEVGNEIQFGSLGSIVKCVPNNWRAIEGFNPDAVFVDELHAFTVTGDRRAFDALVIPPTKRGIRWLTSYAGFEGESVLLEQYWKLAMEGVVVHETLPIRWNEAASLWSFVDQGEEAWRMPWMKGEGARGFLASIQADPSPTAFLRFAMNQWASSEQRFIAPEQWDALEVPEVALRPPLTPALSPSGYAEDRPTQEGKGKEVKETRAFVLAADAATKRDCSALVAAAWNDELERVEIVWCKVWRPEAGEFDLRILGEQVVALHRAYPGLLVKVVYDPYQMSVISTLLAEAGVQVEEFTQTTQRTAADTNFRDLVVGKRLAHCGNPDLRQHVVNAVAVETSRGLRIAKEKTTLKIDAAVAASMAAYMAVEALGYGDEVKVVSNPFYG